MLSHAQAIFQPLFLSPSLAFTPPPHPLSLLLSFQPSSQHHRETGDPETTVTDTSQSGQNTDAAQPPQEHSQEAGAAGTSTVPPGSAELTPLVQVAEDGSGDKDEIQEGNSKKKKEKAKWYKKKGYSVD